MYKILIGLVLIVLFFLSCTNKGMVKNPIENGLETYQVNDSNQKHGIYKRFDLNKNLIEKSFYENGMLQGEVVVFYENGDTLYVETREDGNFHGPYKEFFPGNKLKTRFRYDQNIIATDIEVFYENGQLKERVAFKDNVEHGPFIEYHPNGKLKAEGNYNNGPNEHGELKLYDNNGTLERIMTCDKGICTTTWKVEPE